MAFLFHANQYEKEFGPRRLGNWADIRGTSSRPRHRQGCTQIISNDRGHLLPGIPRPKANPEERFLTTWELPRKITREWCESRNIQRPLIRGTTYKNRRKPVRQETKLKGHPECTTSVCNTPGNKTPTTTIATTIIHKKKTPDVCLLNPPCKDEQKDLQTDNSSSKIPKTEKSTNKTISEKSHSADSKSKKSSQEREVTESTSDKENNMNARPMNYVPGDLTSPRHRPESYYNLLRPKTSPACEGKPQQRLMDRGTSPKSIKPPSPFSLAMRNFAQAKQCFRENLEHEPLPDMLAHKAYRRLQMMRAREPGLALPDTPGAATGVAWKEKLSGPTQCTKMRIYRPKTSGHAEGFSEKGSRPLSCDGSFDMKWRFIKQKDVSPIELAICWDMRPEDPCDEPKRSKHIDGTNDSAGPAVFQIVQSPKEDTSRSNPTSARNISNSRRRSASTESLYVNVSKGAHLAGSTPDLRKISSSKRCTACKGVPLSAPIGPPARSRSEYKMAFKAGVPTGGSICSSGGSVSKGSVTVPKQRDPFAKRNYDINSLSPPFNIVRGGGGGSCDQYPEHWRLATIYQHSYKPPAARRRRLLQNVFQ